VIVTVTIALLQVGVSYVSFRFRRLRPLLAGEPVVIVRGGRLRESNLGRERLTVEEVAEEARMQKIASLEDVQWAMLETTGKISFIPKAELSADRRRRNDRCERHFVGRGTGRTLLRR